MNNKHLTWLPFLPADVPAECKTPVEVARFELDHCGLGDVRLCVEKDQGDAFHLEKTETSYVVTGGETGVLYGAYRLMMALKAGEKVVYSPKPVSPFYALRMINCWDNAEGTVERGNPLGSTEKFTVFMYKKVVDGELVDHVDATAGILRLDNVDSVEDISAILD